MAYDKTFAPTKVFNFRGVQVDYNITLLSLPVDKLTDFVVCHANPQKEAEIYLWKTSTCHVCHKRRNPFSQPSI